MKYIDADKLIAEIEKRRLSNRYIDTEGYENELLEIITSLQQEQPEMDLDNCAIMKEIKKCGCNPNEFDVARHFYELGLNARKED